MSRARAGAVRGAMAGAALAPADAAALPAGDMRARKELEPGAPCSTGDAEEAVACDAHALGGDGDAAAAAAELARGGVTSPMRSKNVPPAWRCGRAHGWVREGGAAASSSAQAGRVESSWIASGAREKSSSASLAAISVEPSFSGCHRQRQDGAALRPSAHAGHRQRHVCSATRRADSMWNCARSARGGMTTAARAGGGEQSVHSPPEERCQQSGCGGWEAGPTSKRARAAARHRHQCIIASPPAEPGVHPGTALESESAPARMCGRVGGRGWISRANRNVAAHRPAAPAAASCLTPVVPWPKSR